MDKIITCIKVSFTDDLDEKKCYFEVPKEWIRRAKKAKFFYLLDKQTEELKVSIFQIIGVHDLILSNDKTDIKSLKEHQEMLFVSEKYLLEIKEDFTKNIRNCFFGELKKYIKELLRGLDYEMCFFRTDHLSKRRKQYLLDIFYNEESKDFYKNTKNYIKKWFYEYNNFELDFIYIINLFMLKDAIYKVIDESINIENREKDVLKIEFHKELKAREFSVVKKGINRYKSNEKIGIDISTNGKNIILGRFTQFQFSINIYSFWNIINRLLTVSYVPIILLLLDSEIKMLLYIILGAVYLITLILSDEVQVENIVSFMNQLRIMEDLGQIENNRKSHYYLFCLGCIITITFIIFSIQIALMPQIVNDVTKLLMYLVGDVLWACMILFLTIAIIDMGIYIISCITSTIIYIKKGKKAGLILKYFIKILFYIFSIYCIYAILGIDIFSNEIEFEVWQWREVVFTFSLLFSFLSIVFNSYNIIVEMKGK